MSDFSRPPQEVLQENTSRDFIGMHFMQGVPILDRDLNLMQDLINESVRSVVSRYLGNGVPLMSDGFKIGAGDRDNDFQILANHGGPGFCLVNGIEVVIRSATTYVDQPRFGADALPVLTEPPADRIDTVCLDVFVDTVDDDEILGNDHDIAMQTSVRLRTAWTVRVMEGRAVPDPPAGHTYFALAELRRTAGSSKIEAAMISDKRQRCVSLETVMGRLIRPEIIRVDPTEARRGEDVTIIGRNFNVLEGNPTVAFGPSSISAKIKAIEGNSVLVTVPDGAPEGKELQLTVTNDAGSGQIAFTVVPTPV